jgi:hypothetical protein
MGFLLREHVSKVLVAFRDLWSILRGIWISSVWICVCEVDFPVREKIKEY